MTIEEGDVWPINKQTFLHNLTFLYYNPEDKRAVDYIAARYFHPMCEALAWTYKDVDIDDLVSIALCECWERIKPDHKRRINSRTGKPIVGWTPDKGSPFSFFSTVIKCAMSDYRKGYLRKKTHEWRAVERLNKIKDTALNYVMDFEKLIQEPFEAEPEGFKCLGTI